MLDVRCFTEKKMKNKNMEEKELKAKDIPWGYALCFNDACSLKDKCMHHLARLMKSDGRDIGQAVFPTFWRSSPSSVPSMMSGSTTM